MSNARGRGMAVTSNVGSNATHGRLFLMGFVVNAVLGYIIYFVAILQPYLFDWASGLIEPLKVPVKALGTAERISDRPLPAQLMILYATTSVLFLTFFYVHCAFFVPKVRQALFERLRTYAQARGVTTSLRLKFVGRGIVLLTIAACSFPVLLSIHDPVGTSWQTVLFFSPTLKSATFLLLLPGIVALAFVLGLGCIYASISRFE